MNLLQMSISGAAMILVVVVIRALAINRLPKKTFIVLWGIVVLRLLVPFSFPSPFSAYSFVSSYVPAPQENVEIKNINIFPVAPIEFPNTENVLQEQTSVSISPYVIIWGIGMIACVLFFAISYFKCRRKFRESLPLKNDFLIQWIAEHKLTRHIQIRQSGRISAPLTYGVFKPIVLMPKGTTCDDINQIEYILAHEFVHIRRFDTAKKMLLTAALCVHWFNPLVWVMYILSNRDIELSCDEAVVRSFGNIKKSDYALTLISMEEKKSNLSPLCNNFSKNAIEERITAIMKIKKTSAISILIAVSLIIGVTTVFATSSDAFNTSFDVTPSAISDKSSSTTSISQSDYNKLFALRFDGYDKMTVEKYREKVKTIIDTPEYTELLKRFEEDAKFYGMRYTNDMSSFFFGTLMPLMDKEWQTQNFEGNLQFSDDNVQGENDVLKYQLSLAILDASRVTVGEYERAREGILDGLSDYLNTKTSAELQDRDVMYNEILNELSKLTLEFSNIALKSDVLFSLDKDTIEMISKEFEQSLAPYKQFGITYELDSFTGQAKMYWNGKQIRGIYDEVKGVWISNSAGNSSFDKGTKEICAVYENQILTGLREATLQEQEEWDRIRSKSSNTINLDTRPYPHATIKDYRSLLKLKTSDYQNKSVADFNSVLLEWADEDYERLERINVDRAWNDFEVPLTDEERSFITLTVGASIEENSQMVISANTGKPKQNPVLGSFELSKKVDKTNNTEHVNLSYNLMYHISDESKLTIGQRDRALTAVVKGIQEYWDNTDVEVLLSMNSKSMLKKLNAITSKNSNGLIQVSFRDNDILFEHISQFSERDE